ncbi:MAG: FAD-dependent oxidoreductase [Opitutaceae bacterium]|nr:FAD-dependent oxidoreductase [Opitutaceae bacterium]
MRLVRGRGRLTWAACKSRWGLGGHWSARLSSCSASTCSRIAAKSRVAHSHAHLEPRVHPHLPRQATPVPNLFLAGAHTRTEADVWSIEGAVESGRRAAQVVDHSGQSTQRLRKVDRSDCFAR